jgi:hypothetical protein
VCFQDCIIFVVVSSAQSTAAGADSLLKVRSAAKLSFLMLAVGSVGQTKVVCHSRLLSYVLHIQPRFVKDAGSGWV